jgi:ribosome-associated toxin RatA of RatAB toxin-antitoxin module
MKPILITTFSFFVLLSGTQASIDDHWELVLDKEGIRVYTQIEAPSPYKQVKVVTTINAPMEKVVEILLAFSGYKNWMNHVDESYLVNIKDSAYYVFFLEDAVWPMQNRYHVSKFNVTQSFAKTHVQFKSVPNYIEKRTDAIQMKQFEGYWHLQDRTDHQCTLEFVLVHHPGGHVPPWLANLHAVDNPFQSISRLKSLAENTRIRP